MSRLSLTLALTVAGLAGVTATGCADPEQIDRVQPDLLDKSAFDGEWYVLGTIVRAPYASRDMFPGLQGSLERGIWQIEKDYLYFYRTYEAVAGAEAQGVRSDVDTPLLDKDGKPVTYERTKPDGTKETVTRYVYRSAPIRKYPISEHLDVRRSYNPMTGEPSNVRIEDSSEKFWFERNSMRVNFGVEEAGDWAGMSFDPSTVTIYEGQEGPDSIKLRVEDQGKYLDFVVRGYAPAPTEYLDGWGYVPSCLFYPWYTGAYYECDQEEIHMRTSFMRVPETNSYEPLAWNDHMLNKFGYYRSARSTYDELYGETWTGADRNIRRFRIWKEYVKGADGKLDYAQMEPNPIVYYLSPEFPRELIKGAKQLADQWNKNFVEVVEARKPGTTAPRMFVLCENNQAEADAATAAGSELASTDPAVCKDMGKVKPLGDLRYNQLVSINDPVEYGLYGYGPMHSDPVSGETIQANAFMYTANVRLGARTAVDMIEYESGVQNFRDITDAKHIENSIAAKKLGISQTAPKKAHSGAMSEADYALEASTAVPEASAMAMAMAPTPTTDTDVATARMNRLLTGHDFDYLWVNQDMAALAGLPLTQMGNAGIDTRDAQVLNDITNPANLGSERLLKWKMEADMQRGIDTMDMREFFDDSIRGLSLEYKARYDREVCDGLQAKVTAGEDLSFNFDAFKEPGAACDTDPGVCGANSTCTFIDQGDFKGKRCMTQCSAGALFDQLRKEIRRVNEISQFVYWDPNALYTDTKNDRVNRSQMAARAIVERVRNEVFLEVYDRMWSTVAMHEVGHNVGFRHNFASSTDALNYFPTYWTLKGSGSGADWKPTTIFTNDTDEQSANKLREYQQTSIMEYSSSFNARNQGLGEYDRAAVLYGYGELAEVFENPPKYSDWQQYLADPSDTDPDQFPVESRRVAPLAKALTKIHHTNYPALFGGIDNIGKRKIVDAYSIEDTAKPCDQHDNPYDSSICGGNGSFCQPFPNGFFCTKPDQVEVPFRFCSDEYNWTTPTCQTWDEGTDAFEIVNNSINDYEAYWPFWAYKRDNDLFNPMSSYWGRVVYEMYGYRKQFEHWALDFARYEHNDWWKKKYGKAWHEDINGGLGATLAAKKIFSHLANMFGRPSDSYYGWNVQRKVYEPYVDDGRNQYTNVFQIREDTGARPIYPSYDFSGYIYTPYRAGTFYDRLAALMYMTYPTSMFTVAVDKTYDVKRFRLNFATIWPQRVQNLFAGIIAGQPNLYGWCVEHDGIGPAEGGNADPTGVKPRLWFGTKQELDDWYSNCTPLNPEPQYDFPTTQYRLPALAAVYGFGWMSYTYDRSFIDRNRLWLQGDGSDITIPANFEKISYTDPFSGKTYVAAYDPAEEDPYSDVEARDVVPADDFESQKLVYWSAARLLAICNHELEQYQGNLSEISANYHYSRLQETVGRLEILRGLYRYFDFGF
ncbi:MAG: zinc-dependent metalloprotease [Myxococcota bacterium]